MPQHLITFIPTDLLLTLGGKRKKRKKKLSLLPQVPKLGIWLCLADLA